MCDVPSIAVFCTESIECFPGTASKFFLIIIIIIIIIITMIATHAVQLATRRGKDIIQHKFLLDETTHRTAARYTAGAACPSGTATTSEGREWRWEALSPTKISRAGYSPWKLRKLCRKVKYCP